ncbi:uncharacterized protein LOC121734982 [Aricia agestis]|uniref:uncharacterized protein LOC121734982 n=1 Tax=Aricia agestis TaxID=91739 RepID=UPI001C20583E|nr:uncharacterized protein LOC121734982 [Aricia agestis]
MRAVSQRAGGRSGEAETPPYITPGVRHTVTTRNMKAIICIVLFAAAVFAAPEGKRDKRGYLHGYHGLELGHSLDLGHSLGHGLGHSLELGHGFGHGFGHDLHLSAPIVHAPAAKIVSYNKVVSVPKVVEYQKIVSVPKVVSVPEVVKVSKIVETPHYHGLSHGWW